MEGEIRAKLQGGFDVILLVGGCLVLLSWSSFLSFWLENKDVVGFLYLNSPLGRSCSQSSAFQVGNAFRPILF
jgi:hypothetical protein